MPQRQLIRDFWKSRAKALKDIKDRLPVRQRAGLPGHKKKRDATPTLNPPTGRVLGIDWGVKEIATTTSDGHDLPHPDHGRKARQQLSRYDRVPEDRRLSQESLFPRGRGQSGQKSVPSSGPSSSVSSSGPLLRTLLTAVETG
ncbi:hypothetical protein QF037_003391 [Streptomyces canus]|nr:hypothetical protein [Streptomyces canus]